jgi:predicted HD phosphohydrolase
MNNLHPVHQTSDGYFNTNSGEKISIHNPTEDTIHFYDIAHALSNLCRFGGHTDSFYSVAQHSVLVMQIAEYRGKEKETAFAALMHDATEAYVQDLIKPLKNVVGDTYAEIESRFEKVICKVFGISISTMKAIKVYDRYALEIEHEYFFKRNFNRFLTYQPQGALNPSKAKMMFLQNFHRLVDFKVKEVAS